MHSITRIAATIEATRTLAWPHFSGSTLRGAFGRALRKAACITGQTQCGGCPLRASCAYGAIFDPAAPAQPLHPSFRDGLPRYLIQPPALGACQLQAGQTQNFSLLLLPGTQTHHVLVEHILQTAVEKELLQPGLFKLVSTQLTQNVVPLAPVPTFGEDSNASARASPDKSHITLRWHLPLRLQHQGKPVFKPQQLDATSLVRALLRRQMQWQQITEQVPDIQTPRQQDLDLMAHVGVYLLDTRDLHWHDIQRHSGTQNQKLPLGGLIGKATLQGPTSALRVLQPLLQLGEQLHIGKETVMGLGRYQLSGMLPG